MDYFTKGQIVEHCMLISRGVRPLFFMPVQKSNIDEAERVILEQALHYEIRDLAPDWVTLYCFKHIELAEIIDDIPTKPTKKIDDVLIGLLCGYGITEICEFLKDNYIE